MIGGDAGVLGAGRRQQRTTRNIRDVPCEGDVVLQDRNEDRQREVR